MSPASKDQLQSQASTRLKHHASQLNSRHRNPNALKFQAKPPPGLPVHITPLNPVQFLLRSALIRPRRVALKHPGIGVEWTYAEW